MRTVADAAFWLQASVVVPFAPAELVTSGLTAAPPASHICSSRRDAGGDRGSPDWVPVPRRFRSRIGAGFADTREEGEQLHDRAVPSWMFWLWQDRVLSCAVFLCGLALLFVLSLLGDLHFLQLQSRLATSAALESVVYLNDAMRRYVFDLQTGFGGLWSSLLGDPPRAPLSTLTALVGFRLFGPQLASAYLASGWILAAYIAAMAWISRPLKGVVSRLLFVAASLFAQVSQAMVTEFRPEMAAGLLFALALLAITTTDLVSASLGRRTLAVVLAMLATIAKPSEAVLAIVGLGTAVAVTVLLQARAGRTPWPKLVAAAALPTIGYVVLLTPFALLYGRQILDYGYQALATSADVWRTGGGPLTDWTYHLLGYGATKALLPFNFIGIVLIAIDIGRLHRSAPGIERSAAYSLYGTIAILYVVMALSAERSPYQGSYLYLPFLFAGAIAGACVLSTVRPVWHVTAGLAVLVVVLAVTRPYGSAYSEPPPPTAVPQTPHSQFTDRLSAFLSGSRSVFQLAPPQLEMA